MDTAKYILIALAVNGAVGYLVYRLQMLQQGSAPEILGGDLIFNRRKGYRILGALTVAFFFSFLLPLMIARADKESPFIVALGVAFMAWMLVFGVWLMFGKIVVSGPSITKRFPWSKQTIEWASMEQVQVARHDGKIVRVTMFSTKEKLAVDDTYIALENLLQEVTNRTGLEPIRMN